MPRTLLVQQVELIGKSGHSQIVWVDASLGLGPGMRVTGKDGLQWTVAKVYETTMEPHLLNRHWNVGGL